MRIQWLSKTTVLVERVTGLPKLYWKIRTNNYPTRCISTTLLFRVCNRIDIQRIQSEGYSFLQILGPVAERRKTSRWWFSPILFLDIPESLFPGCAWVFAQLQWQCYVQSWNLCDGPIVFLLWISISPREKECSWSDLKWQAGYVSNSIWPLSRKRKTLPFSQIPLDLLHRAESSLRIQ